MKEHKEKIVRALETLLLETYLNQYVNRLIYTHDAVSDMEYCTVLYNDGNHIKINISGDGDIALITDVINKIK